MPSEIGQQIMYLTENLLSKQYQQLVADGDIIFYKVDLATPTGQKIAKKCDIVLNGLVVTRRSKIVDLTQKGYQLARSKPKVFQENLAYEIDRLLPKRKRPK
jgi:predicted transcriptional regulator